MKTNKFIKTVSKEAEITEEQAEICLNNMSDFFSKLSEDELTDLFDLYEKMVK